MMKNNYKEYDSLTLYVKKNKVKQVIEYYKVFKWELISETENKRYEDIVDLTFSRPHKIDNKDELQLQQIYMEEKLNEIGRLEKHRHSAITSLGLCLGVLALACILVGVWCEFKIKSIWGIIISIFIIVIGVGIIVAEAIVFPKIYKKNDIKYNKRHKELEDEINNICAKVKTLGGKDE